LISFHSVVLTLRWATGILGSRLAIFPPLSTMVMPRLLCVACWPGPPLVGMLTYSAVVTGYLAYVGFVGGLTGILLWPVVVLYLILTALLTRASTNDKETRT